MQMQARLTNTKPMERAVSDVLQEEDKHVDAVTMKCLSFSSVKSVNSIKLEASSKQKGKR